MPAPLHPMKQSGYISARVSVRLIHLTTYKTCTSFYSRFFGKFADMTGTIVHRICNPPVRYIVLDTRDSFTCSFTEFFPFCPKLYYFSNFKDFNTLTPA